MNGSLKTQITPIICVICVFLNLCSYDTYAQTISGKVLGEKGRGLPFANVYIKNTSIGTTTNQDGYYHLVVPPGTHRVLFQYIGYKVHSETTQTLNYSDTQTFNVTLSPEIYRLKEVVVKATGEDPAYRIIRNAIKRRKYHLNEIESYSCKVYIKGLQRLYKAPKNLLGMAVNVDTGIIYLSESVSELFYKRPDKVKERMIASKVSGDNRAFSFNQASQMMVNFYENVIELDGLNERGFISPIASNALLYYKYKLIGTIRDNSLPAEPLAQAGSSSNGVIINKIKVTPIRKSDPVFKGYIYIVEDSWRLQSVILSLSKGTQIEFLDYVIVKQVFAPVQDNIWMMLSQKFKFALSILGFKGEGYFVAVYSNYKASPALTPSPPKKEKRGIVETERRKTKRFTDSVRNSGRGDLGGAKFFNNEIMAIEKGSNKRDTVYWKKIRPMPLTIEEVKDYRRKDSIEVLSNTKQYRDSLDKKENRFSAGDILYGGYSYYNSYKKTNYSISPLIQNIQFNTVEGFALNLYTEYSKEYENRKFLTIEPSLRYGFSNKHFNATLSSTFYYKPKRFAYISTEFGRFVTQFNAYEPISPFVNSLYSLFNEQNFLKIYEKSFAKIKYRTEIANGLLLNTSLEYAERKPLVNTTSYTWVDYDDREYTPNILAGDSAAIQFRQHNNLQLNISIRIRLKQKYYSLPDQKIIIGSKYPTLTINYKKGKSGGKVPPLGGFRGAWFDYLSLLVRDNFSLKLLGSGYWNVSAGTFLNENKVEFIDYKHFMGNQTIFSTMDQDHFYLLDYYKFSTTGFFVEGHYEHHFNGFVLNKFPLLRRTKFQAVASLNYLYTGLSKNYVEIGIGIEHILKIGRVDLVSSFQQGETKAGVRIGIGF
ncbi:MAG: carboxypeptidase-like regulatory domain-containing protein [Cytophagales bacterium]|nr:carboxypeptidase-like regulatory domain-containing protein [Cytophagales bacterium]